LTVFAIRMAQRPADESHQYGHGRAENLSALAEALILAAGGAFIVTEAVGPSGAVASLVVVVPHVTRLGTGRVGRAFLNDLSAESAS
jgi:divalent metal cation (Fe/Co/Zn/Cd) transporter